MLKKFNEMNIFARIGIIFLVAFMAGLVLPFLSWWVGEEIFTATSSADFCVSCHSMEPFVAANADNLHGGNNDFGIKAS